MPTETMHADEVDTDVSLVRRLLAAQFPHWADLPVDPVGIARRAIDEVLADHASTLH